MASCVKTLVNTLTRPISNTALAVAFSTPLIRCKTPTRASNGIAISNNAAIPRPIAAAPTPVVAIAPITVSGISNSVNVVAKAIRAIALAVAFSTPLMRCKTPTRASSGIAIRVRARTPLRELPRLPVILLRMLIATDMARSSADSATALPIAAVGSISLINHKMPAKAATTMVNVIIGPNLTPFNPFNPFNIREKAAIIRLIPNTAGASFSNGIKDNAITAAAITPMQIAIIMIAPLAF